MEYILTWLLKIILEMILGGIMDEVKANAEIIARDKERGEINEDNVKRYREAKTRAARVKAAGDLLNGTRSH